MLHGLVGFFVDVVCCRWNMGKYSKLKKEENNLPPQSVPTTLGANDISPSPVQGVSLLSQDTASLLTEPSVPTNAQPPTPVAPTIPVQTNLLPQ